ncbi:REP-associated tyrosine transposase [Thiohalophilus thiocyanatoxydans]|uniref:Putative transposase n=1 Tax=Thiohalophilus thiocyanatoxydans TaxID=381308 RepID=A0A4R8IUW4_9GAMM|nr:transposase [Thiohalophilus thiocyanatoxydans]TDY04224.1 putative transposase [Thiohalophilus thiocyanatoxydans]
MGQIRRYHVADIPVFITAVCHNRYPYLKPETNKQLILSVMREVKVEMDYRMLGYVILDNHFHWIIKPEGSNDFSRIMQSVKLRFTRRAQQNDHRIWQRRFWDHLIRDEADLHQHLDYIHFNPVKHGYSASPMEYNWSSYGEYLRRGYYSPDWGIHREPEGLGGLVPE